MTNTANTAKIGDTVRLIDGAVLTITELYTVKHDLPGGAGITLNDDSRREDHPAGEADRWFYADDITAIIARA